MSQGSPLFLDRKDFPQFIVIAVYIAQDGVCGNTDANGQRICFNPLSNGFHRHHNDGDHSNISKENCVLLCLECHYAKKAKQTSGHDEWKRHKELQRKVIKGIFNTIGKLEEGKSAGTTIERIFAGYELAITQSWNILKDEIEYPDPIFSMYKNVIKDNILQAAMMEGYKMGMNSVRQEIIVRKEQ